MSSCRPRKSSSAWPKKDHSANLDRAKLAMLARRAGPLPGRFTLAPRKGRLRRSIDATIPAPSVAGALEFGIKPPRLRQHTDSAWVHYRGWRKHCGRRTHLHGVGTETLQGSSGERGLATPANGDEYRCGTEATREFPRIVGRCAEPCCHHLHALSGWFKALRERFLETLCK